MVIPNKDQSEVLDTLKSIFEKTEYPNYETVIIETLSGSEDLCVL